MDQAWHRVSRSLRLVVVIRCRSLLLHSGGMSVCSRGVTRCQWGYPPQAQIRHSFAPTPRDVGSIWLANTVEWRTPSDGVKGDGKSLGFLFSLGVRPAVRLPSAAKHR